MWKVLDERKEKLIKEQDELIETIYPTYQEIASDIQKRMTEIEKDYGDLSAALKSLQEQLDEVNKKKLEIKDEINSIDIAVDSNDISKIFRDTFIVDNYRHLPQKIVFFLSTFTPGEIQEKELTKLFGALSPISPSNEKKHYSMKTQKQSLEAGSSPPVKQLLVEPETITTIDTGSLEAGSSPPVKQLLDEPETVNTIDTGYKYYLYNVACLSEKEIWTAGEDIMKLFSIKQGSLLKSIRTKSGYMIMHIAVTEAGDLVYTDYDYGTVNIVKNENIEEVIRLEKWKPYGVCSSSSGDLLVVMDSEDYTQSKVIRYSGSTVKQTIQFDEEGNSLFSSNDREIKHICENKNLDICVSDSDAGVVVVVNQVGQLRFKYIGNTSVAKKNPFKPQGITTDSQSHILTADFINDCIHIIDQGGKFLRFIKCGLSRQRGLCTDKNDNLFVAQDRNRQVKKIKYQQ
ncbi:uncharacterized protein LOC133178175 [Saccostrea echinata]|uniref:uncharacterized protein LOC133178175 n=1 Tax=Saccostrea echinata TaxID=191078 RepID=UPI002A81A0C2|nr:uncharacterized protein LOC133178175 [Saccostrea echinata]